MTFFRKYLILFSISLLIVSLAWSFLAQDRLYHCNDPFPPFAFIPPFVHQEPAKENYGDYYIAPENEVYSLWKLALFGVIVAPFLLIILLNLRSRTRYFGR